MTSVVKLMRGLWGSRLKPGSVSTKTSAILRTDDLIEEQTLPRYCPKHYYPVHVGDTFDDRYQVIAKLGFGASSTIWLARDIQKWRWQENRYVTLKILTNSLEEKTAASTELEMSRCIATINPKSKGLRYLRTVLHSFEVVGPEATHVGLVYTPMRESLSLFQRRLPNGRLPGYFLKSLLELVLTGLDYLHTECHIIHTDLKPDNILLGIEDQAAIEGLVRNETKDPSPYKIEGSRAIYASRNFGDFQAPPGRPKIADFGLAVWGDVSQAHNHPIQPDLFQAPEVILQAGWTYSADIWNLGVMLWDLVENRTLFDALDPVNGAYSPAVHLGEMTSLFGPIPTNLLKRGEKTYQYLTAEGKISQSAISTIGTSTLESCLTSFTGEDKRLFLDFVRKMLQWMPEDRATARELLKDPWLTS